MANCRRCGQFVARVGHTCPALAARKSVPWGVIGAGAAGTAAVGASIALVPWAAGFVAVVAVIAVGQAIRKKRGW